MLMMAMTADGKIAKTERSFSGLDVERGQKNVCRSDEEARSCHHGRQNFFCYARAFARQAECRFHARKKSSRNRKCEMGFGRAGKSSRGIGARWATNLPFWAGEPISTRSF